MSTLGNPVTTRCIKQRDKYALSKTEKLKYFWFRKQN